MEWECCGELTVAERFYGTNSIVAAWTYDGFRCVNYGAIAENKTGMTGRNETCVFDSRGRTG